jgi:hypothetical protein
LLINIFLYVNSDKILTAKEAEVVRIKENLKAANVSIDSLKASDYFSIETDQDAQDYFYNKNLDYSKVMAKINEDLVSLNTNKAGNKLVPYEAIEGKAFIINKAKMLNHRWIIAEYSNSKLWGQVLIKYFHNEDKPTDFETVETIMYDNKLPK